MRSASVASVNANFVAVFHIAAAVHAVDRMRESTLLDSKQPAHPENTKARYNEKKYVNSSIYLQ